MKEIQVCSNEGPYPFSRGENNEIAKIHLWYQQQVLKQNLNRLKHVKVYLNRWRKWKCENFSLIWRCHHCRWRAVNFDLCSALMAIEQWGFFSVPDRLWHGASILMVISEDPYCWAFSSRAITTCFYDLALSWLGFERPTFRLQDERSSPLRHRRG